MQMLNAIDKLLSSHGERNIRENIKNKKRKTRKSKRKKISKSRSSESKKQDRPIDF